MKERNAMSGAGGLQADIGSRLRRLRTDRGLTQKELAGRIEGGLDYTYIGKVERGDQLPSLKVLVRLGEALDVPVSCFFGAPTVTGHFPPSQLRAAKSPVGMELLTLLQQLPEEALPLLADIVRAMVRHRQAREELLPLAAEEQPRYDGES